MTLVLDERRQAMLREMGLRLLPPLSSPGPAAPAQDAVLAGADPAPSRAERGEVRPPLAAPAATRAAGELPGGVADLGWDALQAAVAGCTACGLCATRRNAVFGVGAARADWMVIGEAPGEDEDAQGEPFLGQHGQLLDNMLRAIGLDRQRNVFVTNALKCRPPGNRNPDPQEIAQCEPFLRRQVELLQPRIILAMGRFAVQSLLQTQEPIGRLRGRAHQYLGVPVVVTYHPAYLLRNLADKGKAWADLCMAMDLVEGRG